MEKYIEYAKINREIEVLEDRKNELRAEILKRMIENGEEKIDTDVGSFAITRIKKWEYPMEVYNLETDYKIAKSNAELKGTATYTEKESLRFTNYNK